MQDLLPGIVNIQNIHPLFVHFPVALLPVAFAMQAAGFALKRNNVWVFGRWLLYLGLAGGVFALATGYAAADAMGHDSPGHGLVHGHRDLIIGAMVTAAVTALVQFVLRNKEGRSLQAVQLALLGITCAVLALGADLGAEMVYRYGVGVSRETPPKVAHSHGGGGSGHSHGAAAGGGHGEAKPSGDGHGHAATRASRDRGHGGAAKAHAH